MKQQSSGISSNNGKGRSNKIHVLQENADPESNSGQRQGEIERMKDANNVKGTGKVAKNLGVARSINFAAGGHHDKKYDFLFNDDDVEVDQTPRNNERNEQTTEPFDSARYGPNSTKKMLEPRASENVDDGEPTTMPSSNYNK